MCVCVCVFFFVSPPSVRGNRGIGVTLAVFTGGPHSLDFCLFPLHRVFIRASLFEHLFSTDTAVAQRERRVYVSFAIALDLVQRERKREREIVSMQKKVNR